MADCRTCGGSIPGLTLYCRHCNALTREFILALWWVPVFWTAVAVLGYLYIPDETWRATAVWVGALAAVGSIPVNYFLITRRPVLVNDGTVDDRAGVAGAPDPAPPDASFSAFAGNWKCRLIVIEDRLVKDVGLAIRPDGTVRATYLATVKHGSTYESGAADCRLVWLGPGGKGPKPGAAAAGIKRFLGVAWLCKLKAPAQLELTALIPTEEGRRLMEAGAAEVGGDVPMPEELIRQLLDVTFDRQPAANESAVVAGS